MCDDASFTGSSGWKSDSPHTRGCSNVTCRAAAAWAAWAAAAREGLSGAGAGACCAHGNPPGRAGANCTLRRSTAPQTTAGGQARTLLHGRAGGAGGLVGALRVGGILGQLVPPAVAAASLPGCPCLPCTCHRGQHAPTPCAELRWRSTRATCAQRPTEEPNPCRLGAQAHQYSHMLAPRLPLGWALSAGAQRAAVLCLRVGVCSTSYGAMPCPALWHQPAQHGRSSLGAR